MVWEPCSLYPGEGDGLAECAEVEMPLRWGDSSEGGGFRTLAKRLRSSEPDGEGQVWLLPGGPGQSGTLIMPAFMEDLRDLNPDLDFYTLDHRGTGGSEWLGCPVQESAAKNEGRGMSLDEIDACIDYLDGTDPGRLDVYGATHAAIDLAAFIHHTSEESEKVLLWGFSAGTFWIQRYLQFFPDQVDGVILEGIVPPDESLVFMDESFDRIGRELLADCQADDFCSSKLPDPEATLASLLQNLDRGHCQNANISSLSLLALILDLNYFYPTNQLGPALIYRLIRCSPADVDSIYQLLDFLYPEMGPELDHSYSQVLSFNQISSELWEHSAFKNNNALLAYLDGVYDDILFGFGLGYYRNEVYLRWPRYSDPDDDRWANSAVPMLMLQGQLDPATPHDEALRVAEHFDGPFQHWASFPHGAHNVSHGYGPPDGEYPPACGASLALAFIRDPKGDLDLSCIDETLPPDFEGRTWAPTLMGTEDFFENVPASSRSRLSSQQLAELQRVRDRLRDLRVQWQGG